MKPPFSVNIIIRLNDKILGELLIERMDNIIDAILTLASIALKAGFDLEYINEKMLEIQNDIDHSASISGD